MRWILLGLLLLCPAQTGAEEAAQTGAEETPKVLSLEYSKDSLTLEITTPQAVWRFGLDTGTVLDHQARESKGDAAPAIPKDGVRSPNRVWRASEVNGTTFSDATWAHIRLHRKGTEHGATLSLGPDRAWLLEVYGPWFMGNEAALRPMCETWSYPYRTLDKAIDTRVVAEAAGFWEDGIGSATPTSKALAAVEDEGLCADRFKDVPSRAALEKELAGIVGKAGGAITFHGDGGGISWWQEAGDRDRPFFFELGEILGVDLFPPLGLIVFECGRWSRESRTWHPAACGAVRNDRSDHPPRIKVRPEDTERAYQLFKWLLLRRGEYGEPMRMM